MIRTHLALGISLFFVGSLAWANEAADQSDTREISKWIRVLEENPTLNAKQIEQLTTFVSAHPKDARAHRLMAKAYGKIGTPDFACAEVEEAWRLDPINIEDLAAALHYYALNHETEKFDKLVSEAFSTYKNEETPLSAVGQFLARTGDDKNAERFFARADEISPHNPLNQVFLLQTMLNLGKNKEAFAKTGELIANPNTAPIGLYLRGKALCGMRRYAEACSLYAKAYKQEKRTPELTEAYFDTLIRCDRYKEALAPGLQVIALVANQNNELESTKRSIIEIMKHLSSQDIEEAIRNISKTNPSAYFYFSLGNIFDRLGKSREAIQFYAKGIELNPHYGPAFMRIGQDMEKNSNYWNEALQLYERAYSLNPDDPSVGAHYKRFFSRFPHKDQDIALRLKNLVNR